MCFSMGGFGGFGGLDGISGVGSTSGGGSSGGGPNVFKGGGSSAPRAPVSAAVNSVGSIEGIESLGSLFGISPGSGLTGPTEGPGFDPPVAAEPVDQTPGETFFYETDPETGEPLLSEVDVPGAGTILASVPDEPPADWVPGEYYEQHPTPPGPPVYEPGRGPSQPTTTGSPKQTHSQARLEAGRAETERLRGEFRESPGFTESSWIHPGVSAFTDRLLASMAMPHGGPRQLSGDPVQGTLLQPQQTASSQLEVTRLFDRAGVTPPRFDAETGELLGFELEQYAPTAARDPGPDQDPAARARVGIAEEAELGGDRAYRDQRAEFYNELLALQSREPKESTYATLGQPDYERVWVSHGSHQGAGGHYENQPIPGTERYGGPNWDALENKFRRDFGGSVELRSALTEPGGSAKKRLKKMSDQLKPMVEGEEGVGKRRTGDPRGRLAQARRDVGRLGVRQGRAAGARPMLRNFEMTQEDLMRRLLLDQVTEP